MSNIIELINNNLWDKAIDKSINISDNILDGNNILHVACIRGNIDVVNKIININKDNDLIYKSNSTGLNILHILFKYGWYDYGYTIYLQFPKLLNNIDETNITPLFYILDKKELLTNILNNYIKNNTDFNLFNKINLNNNKTILLELIDRNDFDNIDLIVKYVDLTIPVKSPPLHYLLNKKITDLKLYKLFILINKDILELNDEMHLKPINYACLFSNNQAILLLLNFNVNLDYGGFENDFLPFNLCIKEHNIDGLLLIYKVIKIYNIIDKNGNTYLHNLLLDNDNFTNKNKIVKYLIKNTDINKKNLDNISCYNLLKNKKIIKKNKNNQLDVISKDFNFDFITSDKNTNGIFDANFIYNILYTYYIISNYKNITCPLTDKNNNNKEYLRQLTIQYVPYDAVYLQLYNIVYAYQTYFDYILPYLIIWKNKYIYYIHPKFTDYLKNCYRDKRRFIMIKITLILSATNSHANIVLIDKEKKDVRRFEPYGVSDIMDCYYLDEMIKKEIINIDHISKYKYYKPSDYLYDAGFQNISNHDLYKNRNIGDPEGYCLAWCFWYIELKLSNPNISEKELIENAVININKLNDDNKENSFILFIRNYGKTLDKYKNNILNLIGIEESKYYNTTFSEEDKYKISIYIKQYIYKMNYITDIKYLMFLFPYLPHKNDYNKLLIDDETSSYITNKIDGEKITNILTTHIKKFKNVSDSIIVDATGGAGGDTIHFAKKFMQVISIEKDTTRIEFIKNNIAVYNLKNVIVINDDTLKVVPKLTNIDVLFLDPPWGGKNYKEKTDLKLYMNDIDIDIIISDFLAKEKMLSIPKIIALKLPKNFYLTSFVNKLKPTNNIYVYELKKMLIVVVENKNILQNNIDTNDIVTTSINTSDESKD